MQYYRCKCGDHTAWTSMGVPSCVTCKKCGSDLAQSPDGHSDPEPHSYKTKYNENTGEPYEICSYCMNKRSEIEAESKPDPLPVTRYPYLELVTKYPHCDMYVLHMKGSCESCDLPSNVPLHKWRDTNRINHTGENDPSKSP